MVQFILSCGEDSTMLLKVELQKVSCNILLRVAGTKNLEENYMKINFHRWAFLTMVVSTIVCAIVCLSYAYIPFVIYFGVISVRLMSLSHGNVRKLFSAFKFALKKKFK